MRSPQQIVFRASSPLLRLAVNSDDYLPGSELVDHTVYAAVLSQDFSRLASKLCEHVRAAVDDKENEKLCKRGQKRLRFIFVSRSEAWRWGPRGA